MSYLDMDVFGRQERMAAKSALIAGGIAAVVAAVLIWSAANGPGDTPTALAVGDSIADTSSSTTSTAAPTTTTSTTTTPAVPETTTTTEFYFRDGIEEWFGLANEAISTTAPESTSDAAPEASSEEPADTQGAAAPVANAPTTASPATGPAAVSIPRPACANNVGALTTRTAPFTGLSASIPANMPAVVVKVSNNNSASRASLIGLDQADIVFEERIEASATRFFSIFHSQRPANVGPVRSGRTTDIQLTQNLGRPVMGYSGSNPGVAAQIRFAADNNILVPVVNNDLAPFARDGRYRAPDNLFVDPTALGGCGGGGSPRAIFSYGANNSTTAQPASSVALSARSNYRFDWNGSAWVRSQSGSTHTTRTGELLDPKNVVVMFVNYVQSQVDPQSVDAETIGSGQAWIFRNGTATIGSWSRQGAHPYVLSDGNGNAMNLDPGQTWVVLAPPGSASWSG